MNLTAAQLIAILLEHPLTCGALGVTFEQGGRCVRSHECVFDDFHAPKPPRRNKFRRWLTGALVEAHVERGIELPSDLGDGWLTEHDTESKHANDWTYHPTILHALLTGPRQPILGGEKREPRA